MNMIEVVDAAASRRALTARRLPCPDCGAPLRPWGHARPRTVHDLRDTTVTARPDRARCTACQNTHVILAAGLLPHRAYTAGPILAALGRAAEGTGHRAIAADLGLPADTVRGWLRRARARAQTLWHIGARTVVALDPDTLMRLFEFPQLVLTV